MSDISYSKFATGRWLDDARWFGASAALTLIAALIGLRLQVDGIALFWPAAGVAAGLMVISRRRGRVMVALGLLAALAFGNISQGRSLATSVVFMSGNLVQALLIAWILDRTCGWPVRLDRIGKVVLFLGVAIAAPAVVGLGMAAGLKWAGHTSATFGEAWWIWASSHAVGLVSVMPAVLLLRGLTWGSFKGQAEDVFLVLAIATAAVVVLGAVVPETSLLMLLMLVLLVPLAWWVTLRANVARAAIALAILAVVTIWTAAGNGLFSHGGAWAGQAFLVAIGALLLLLGAWRSQHNGGARDTQRRLSEIGDLRALVLLVPLMLFAAYTWWSWREAEAQAKQRVAERASIIAEHATRVFETQEAMLKAVLARVRGRAAEEIAGDVLVYQFLAELARTTETSSAITLVDPESGRRLATSTGFPPAAVDLSDRGWVAAHRDDEALVHIGQLIRMRPSGRVGLTVSRRDPKSGLVAMSLVNVDALSRPFALAREDTEDVLTLVRRDGVTLAMGRPGADPFGFRLPPDAVFMRWMRGEVALPTLDQSGVDGGARLWQVVQAGGYPVYAIYGLTLGQIRAWWLARLVPFGLLSLLAAGGLWVLMYRLQRTAAEAAAARADARNAAALQESEARFRSLASMSSDWYWEQDENLRFVDFSHEALEEAGFTSPFFLGKARWEVPGATTSKVTWADHRAVLQRHDPFRNFEYCRLNIRGEALWLSVNGDPVFDGEGNFKGYRGTGTNITERKEAEDRLRASEARFRSLASMSSDWYWEQDENFRYVEFSETVLELAGSSSASHIGKTRWELPHLGVREEVWAEHRAALERHEPFRNFEYRRLNELGEAIWMNVNGDPVFDGAGNFKGYRGTGANITERKDAEERLRASEARQRIAAEAAGLGVFEWRLAEERAVWENVRMFELFGRSPAEGPLPREAFFSEFVVPEDAEAFGKAIAEAMHNGSAFTAACRIHRSGDGELRWLEFAGRCEYAADGSPTRVIGVVADITERQRHEEHIEFLLREVNHRSKNMLGLIQAIARQTASTTPKDFLARFSERLHSLAAAQDLLIRHNWTAVPLAELVHLQLSHFADLIGDRITVTGPDLSLHASASQTIAMVLHELATNAAKHGALSVETGRIAIDWDVGWSGEAAPQFTMSWSERGGPNVATPERLGFGWTVTSSMVKMTLGGEVDVDYAPSGLVWRLACPAGKVVEGPVEPSDREALAYPAPAAEGQARPGGGCRILVVEDEALIACEIEGILSDAGFDVIGPVNSVAKALALIRQEGCDAAVLDVNLGAETSEPVAAALIGGGKPFITVSGYARLQQPAIFRGHPLVPKPVHAEALLESLRDCLETPSPAAARSH